MHLLIKDFSDSADVKSFYHPNNIIKVESYALMYDHLIRDKAEVFLRNAARLNIFPGNSRPIDFANFALKALTLECPFPLSSINRSKYALMLRYAYDHNVSPNWLPAFLLQTGGYAAIATKVKLNRREIWRTKKPKVPYPSDIQYKFPAEVVEDNDEEVTESQ